MPLPYALSVQPLALSSEAAQRPTDVAFTQPLERAVAQLADALARDAEHRADLLERVLSAALEPEVETQDFGVAGRERVERGQRSFVGFPSLFREAGLELDLCFAREPAFLAGHALHHRIDALVIAIGEKRPDLPFEDPEKLNQIVLADLRQLLGVTGRPSFAHHHAFTKGIPQYEVGYGRLKDLMDRLEQAAPGLFLAGHFRDGVSLGDSNLSADNVAGRIDKHLSGLRCKARKPCGEHPAHATP